MRVLVFGVGAIGSIMVHAKEDPMGGRMKADYKNWVLKKGGCFAIHDIMSKSRYGDMQEFADKLRAMGYEEVKLIPTDDGIFMSKAEAKWMGLSGSTLLVGKK